MSTYTEILNLYKADTTSDEELDEYINVKEIFENNPDRMEQFAKEIKQNITNIEDKNTEQDTKISDIQTNIEENKQAIAKLEVKKTALETENAELKKDIEATSLTGEAEGESIVIKDSSGARFKKIELSGNSVQKSRTGYNLLNPIKGLTEKTINGVTFTPNFDSDGNLLYINVNGTATGEAYFDVIGNSTSLYGLKTNSTYTGSITTISGKTFFRIYTYTTNWTALFASTSVKGFTIPDGSTGIIFRIAVSDKITVNNEKVYPMILDGNYTIDNLPYYEPYGAMPSLDYPSEVKVVKDNINLVKCNKNLFNINAQPIQPQSTPRRGNLTITGQEMHFNSTDLKWSTVAQRAWVIKLLNQDDIYISAKSTIRPFSNNAGIFYCFSKEKPTISDEIPKCTHITNSINGKQIKVTPDADAKYLVIMLQSQYIPATETKEEQDRTITVKNLMISYSSNSDYVAHESEQISMPCQKEMLEDDYFDLENYKEIHNIKHIVLDGVNYGANYVFPNGWFIIQKYESDGTSHNIRDVQKPELSTTVEKIKCSHLKAISAYSLQNGLGTGIAVRSKTANDGIAIKLDDATEETNTWTKETINAYLKENNLDVYYLLVEPEILDMTEQQKITADKLNNLRTYKNGTNLYDTDEVSTNKKVVYYKDLETVINNINNAITVAGGDINV